MCIRDRAKAPRGKEGRAAITQITGELNVIETRVKEVEAALREDITYAEALDRLNAAQKSVTDINTELTEAIAKKKGDVYKRQENLLLLMKWHGKMGWKS